jgi:pyochelin synthetase
VNYSGGNYRDVLREVERRGLRLTVSGDNLRLQGPRQRADPDLVGQIKAVKPELLGYLTASAGFPLTLLQRGYLIGRGDSVEMGNTASHIYHEIDGRWDLTRLESALREVVARHPMLRTSFTPDGRQVTLPSVPVAIGRLDLRGLPAAEQEARLAELREQRSHRILPADRAPLLAADVTLLADDRMRLHVGHDGLVMDAISMFAFFDQWWRAYNGKLPAEPGGAEGPHASFADYVASIEEISAGPAGQRSRDWWLARLDDLPPHPELPLAASPAAIGRPRFVQHTVRLDAARWAALRERAAEAGVTPTVALLTAYAETLARWGAGRRFTLTTTVAVRPPGHAAAIGNFSQTMLVEVVLDTDSAFTARARAMQARMRADLDHRHFSGIEVLRELARRQLQRDGAATRMPFTFNSAIGHDGPDGSALELFGPEVYTSSQTPQLWLNGFCFESGDGLVAQFDEVAGLFPDGLIAALVSGYAELLGRLTSGAAWQAARFDLLPPDQRARRRAANDTARPVSATLLPALFAEQAARTPQACAVLTSGGALSYRELFAGAAGAAAWLREHGLRRDELAALVMSRGSAQVTGILATVMAGGAYLPVDAALPAERVRYMLRDGRVRCVLTSTGWRPDENGAAIDVLDLPAAVAGSTWDPLPGASLDDLAYVLYTSGTTGEPKGVMVSQRSVANVVADCNERFGVGPGDRFMAISAFSFDLSVYDVFGALSAGAALVMPDADRAADPAHWLELCARFGVTVWNSVPAIARLLAEQARPGDLASLRLVMLSGDRIPATLPAALRRAAPDARLVSLGGPTETTIWNVWHPIADATGSGGRIPYGRPNANNRAYILDADDMDAPEWVTGEICAAGAGLARGYWADEARTAARFYRDERLGERIYRTGDLGRYLPDGTMDILGRADFQVKINGHRVEAGEVEARLGAIAAIKQAVVVRQPGTTGDRLVAHLVQAGARPGDDEIRRTLAEHLPGYMVPSLFVWHEILPLTRNGKVDRVALSKWDVPGAPSGRSGARHAAVAGPIGPLRHIWGEVLGIPEAEIGEDADLFELGGDSLAAARIFTAVRKETGVGITLDQLYLVRTVAGMAGFVESLRESR